MTSPSQRKFKRHCNMHLQHLKLKGLQPKTVEAYSRAIQRIGDYFDHEIYDHTKQQLPIILPICSAPRPGVRSSSIYTASSSSTLMSRINPRGCSQLSIWLLQPSLTLPDTSLPSVRKVWQSGGSVLAFEIRALPSSVHNIDARHILWSSFCFSLVVSQL